MRHSWIAIFAGALLLLMGAPSPTVAAQPLTLTAELTGGAEVPSVHSGGSGQAVVVINSERTALSYRITYRALSSPLRLAAFCIGWSTTDIACPFIGAELPLGPSPLVGTRPIFGIQAQNWASGQAWVQLTTTTYPQGEIRGLLGQGAPPKTSTTPGPRGTPVDGRTLVPLVTGLFAGWAFLRRLDAHGRRRRRPSPR
jgi:hypothetical protein